MFGLEKQTEKIVIKYNLSAPETAQAINPDERKLGCYSYVQKCEKAIILKQMIQTGLSFLGRTSIFEKMLTYCLTAWRFLR